MSERICFNCKWWTERLQSPPHIVLYINFDKEKMRRGSYGDEYPITEKGDECFEWRNPVVGTHTNWYMYDPRKGMGWSPPRGNCNIYPHSFSKEGIGYCSLFEKCKTKIIDTCPKCGIIEKIAFTTSGDPVCDKCLSKIIREEKRIK